MSDVPACDPLSPISYLSRRSLLTSPILLVHVQYMCFVERSGGYSGHVRPSEDDIPLANRCARASSNSCPSGMEVV